MSRLPFPRPYCKSLSFGFNISVLLMGIPLGACFVFGGYLATLGGEPVRGMFSLLTLI